MNDALRPANEILHSSGEMLLYPIPQTVCFEPLYSCNLRCSYCYIGKEKNIVSPSVPPLELTMQILRTIREEGVKEIYLAGGEPLFHPNFARICEHIVELGFEHRGIVTNGTLITRRLAQLLKQLDFWVNITFRGSNPEIFDQATTIKGSFQEALKGLHNLADIGLCPGIEHDPIPANHDLLYEMVSMLVCEKIPIREVWLHRVAPFGDAALVEDLQLSIEQYRTVLSQAKRIKEDFDIDVAFEDGLPLCLIDQEFYTHIVPCACGITLANVDPFGNLRRCACHSKEYGNILETSLSELWHTAFQEFRSLNWISSSCKNCTLLSQCGGGCSVTLLSSEGHAVDRFSENFTPIVPSL